MLWIAVTRGLLIPEVNLIYSAPGKIFCTILVLLAAAGCSGTSTSDYEQTTTYHGRNQVVTGLVYGYAGKSLSAVTAQTETVAEFLSPDSGQFAITGYPASNSAEGDLVSASFTDGTRLYSVWDGLPAPYVDVTVTYFQTAAPYPASVTVSPDDFDARLTINPLTDLAYWYWIYDKKKSPYSDYLTAVFWLFRGKYLIPVQNAAHDYPSPELKDMLNRLQIKVLDDASGFSLIDRASGQTACIGTFVPFLNCN